MTLIKRNGRVLDYTLPSLPDDFFTRDALKWGTGFSNTGTSVSAVNIKETNDSFEVELAAPGMEKKDFKIELDGNFRLTAPSYDIT